MRKFSSNGVKVLYLKFVRFYLQISDKLFYNNIMFPLLIKAKNIALDVLFPQICPICEKSLEEKSQKKLQPICGQCLNSIKLNNSTFCPVCRARLPENRKICHQNSHFILAAAGNYDNPAWQKLIQAFKYQGLETLAPILGNLMIRYVENSKLEIVPPRGIPQSGKNFIVVPIPLHKSRERQRGFNQAQLLAEIIAKHFNLPLAPAIGRIKKTEPQARMKNKEERLKNIAGCFKITNREFIENKNIILVDDVFTTGDTINEAVKILKIAGAKKIIALAAAKA